MLPKAKEGFYVITNTLGTFKELLERMYELEKRFHDV